MAEYTLHIDINNLPSENSKAKEKLDNVTNNNKKESSGNDKLDNLVKAAKAVGAVKLAKQVVNIGKQELNYRINTYGAKYGDTARQNELQNMMTTLDMGTSFVKSTVTGVVAGATFGPWGALAGAIIGSVSDAIGKVVDITHKTEEWQRQQYINNLNETRASERLGLMKTDRQRGRR